MTFDSPEIEKLRRIYQLCGNEVSMKAKFATPAGDVEVDLIRILLELAARDDSNLHFMDPPKHHTGTPVERVRVEVADNPTAQAAIGSP